ncbi:MAG: dihydroorotate dehydrogenase [Myxococcota bacterium]
MPNINISTTIGSLALKNPVMVASGCAGFGEELANYYPLSKLGAFVTKGLSLKPKVGNPPPRTCEVTGGMLNSIGLENPGLDVFLAEKLPFLKKRKATVVVNIFGNTIAEYAELAEKLDGVEGVSALELNISCPNVDKGGRLFGYDAASASALTKTVRVKTSLPLFVKLSPMVSDIVEVAKAVLGEGADALSLVNTIPAMAIDTARRKPLLGKCTGGLSGAAIKPVALYCVYKVYEATKAPIIGIGGIYCADDALEFILAGASAIQIGTANFFNPKIALDVIEGLKNHLKQHRLPDMKPIIAAAHKA